jgi:hypothetical protein
MKQVLRSKSDTKVFFYKQYLDMIHNNLNKLKSGKKQKSEILKRKNNASTLNIHAYKFNKEGI